MEREALNEWIRRYRTYLLNLHEPKYFVHPNRDKYITFFQKRILNFSLLVGENRYLLNIIELYKEGGFLNEQLPNILQKIDKRRTWWKEQQYFGEEYSQPYYHVGDLVKDERKRTVTKFLVQVEVANFFLEFTRRLEKAIKRGEIGMQEEKDLFAKAKQGILPDKKEAPLPVVGFFWEGGDISMKLKVLHEGLIKLGMIDKKTTPERFSLLFKGIAVTDAVQWRGTMSQLVFLIGELYNRNLLQKTDELKGIKEKDMKSEQAYGSWLYSKLCACFTDKHGKRLQSKNLKQTKNDIENKDRFPAKGELLQNLVQQVVETSFLKSLEREEKKN